MAITFRKSFTVFPGIRINVNAKSWSVTFGPKHGPHYTRSSTGRRTTSMDLPGPFGYRRTTTRNTRRRNSQ